MEINDKNSLETSVEKKNSFQNEVTFHPIGRIWTVFTEKNGTPRQGQLCTKAKGILTLTFTEQGISHSLEGLEQFTHIWLIFAFHENTSVRGVINKISPPRLEGKRVGVFATRSPHRPNPIGLSVAKLDKIEGSMLYLSGIDLINGTPILDIKPYISRYDSFPQATISTWIAEPPRPQLDKVLFDSEAEKQLKNLLPMLKFYDNYDDIKTAIEEVLIQDPRSVYFKENRSDTVYP